MATRLDPNQVIKREHDEAASAKRVKIVQTQMEISTDEAEDTIAVRPISFRQEVEVGDIVDISKHKETFVYLESTGASTGTLTIQVSPDDAGGFFVASGSTLATGSSAVVSVTTKGLRLRISGTTPNGRLIVVGRG